jgi:Uma2 family endonuclease
VVATQTLVSFEQFLELSEREDLRVEFDEGVVIEMAPAAFKHGTVQGTVIAALKSYADGAGSDLLVSVAAGFRLAPKVARIPDVCLVRRATFAAMKKIRGWYQGAPELSVEVVSPGDSATDIDRKIDQYLAAGGESVWLVYPETRHVMIYRRAGEALRLSCGQAIEEPGLLPGFHLAVEAIFAGTEDLS